MTKISTASIWRKDGHHLQMIIDGRHKFILAYMEKKGWGDDLGSLSIDQILEIRKQPGWKNPLER